MQFLWKYVDELVGKGLEIHILLELLFYASSTFVPLALPLAILLSSLMTFGNLGEHYELVAMKSTGISLRRIMQPLVILSILISIFAFFFSNNILPVANLKFYALLYDVRQKKLTFNIQEGVFNNDIEGLTIYVREKDADDNTIRNVMIYDHSDRMGNIRVTTARWGKIALTPDQKMLVLNLYDGHSYEDIVDRVNYRINRPFQRISFKEQTQLVSGLDFTLNRTDEALFRNNYQMMDLQQLRHTSDSLKADLLFRHERVVESINERFYYFHQLDSLEKLLDTLPVVYPLSHSDSLLLGRAVESALQSSRAVKNHLEFNYKDLNGRRKRIVRHDLEWHRKFTLSAACLILFFIGAPLGAIIRKGGLGMPVVFSIVFFVLFHVISMTSEKYARAGALSPDIALWIAPALLLPLGIFLTYKATTDSPLLDAESWNKIFRKLSLNPNGTNNQL